MSPLFIQYLLLGVGIWLAGTLTVVGYLVMKNVIMQKHVLKNFDYYLSRQTKQLDYLCMLNGTMIKSLKQTKDKIESLEIELKGVHRTGWLKPGERAELGRMHG